MQSVKWTFHSKVVEMNGYMLCFRYIDAEGTLRIPWICPGIERTSYGTSSAGMRFAAGWNICGVKCNVVGKSFRQNYLKNKKQKHTKQKQTKIIIKNALDVIDYLNLNSHQTSLAIMIIKQH